MESTSPDRTDQFSDATPVDDDRVIDERHAPRQRLPNQHDLDTDDDQVLRTERAAPWSDFDDLEDAVLPRTPDRDDDRPADSPA